MNTKSLFGVALLALVVGAPAMAQESNKSTQPKSGEPKAAQTACMEMIQGSGLMDESRKAMREFMESPTAPRAMNSMMEMARRMGNGDLMFGMSKMMEMMGGQGGMMGGSDLMSHGMMSSDTKPSGRQ